MKPIQRGLLLNSEAQFLFIYFESTDTYDWQRQPIVWEKSDINFQCYEKALSIRIEFHDVATRSSKIDITFSFDVSQNFHVLFKA